MIKQLILIFGTFGIIPIAMFLLHAANIKKFTIFETNPLLRFAVICAGPMVLLASILPFFGLEQIVPYPNNLKYIWRNNTLLFWVVIVFWLIILPLVLWTIYESSPLIGHLNETKRQGSNTSGQLTPPSDVEQNARWGRQDDRKKPAPEVKLFNIFAVAGLSLLFAIGFSATLQSIFLPSNTSEVVSNPNEQLPPTTSLEPPRPRTNPEAVPESNGGVPPRPRYDQAFRFPGGLRWDEMTFAGWPAFGICYHSEHNSICLSFICPANDPLLFLLGTGGAFFDRADFEVYLGSDKYVLQMIPADITDASYEALSLEPVPSELLTSMVTTDTLEIMTDVKWFIADVKKARDELSEFVDTCTLTSNMSPKPLLGDDADHSNSPSARELTPFDQSKRWNQFNYRGETGFAVCDVGTGRHRCFALFCRSRSIRFGVVELPSTINSGQTLEVRARGKRYSFSMHVADPSDEYTPYFVSENAMSSALLQKLREDNTFEVDMGTRTYRVGLGGSAVAINILSAQCN